MLADVELDAGHLSPEPAYFFGQRFERRRRAAGDDQIRPRLRQHAGKMLPQAAACAGDHRHAIGQIKRFTHDVNPHLMSQNRSDTDTTFSNPGSRA